MIKETIIDGHIFLEQTTYYVYRKGDTRETGIPFVTTSDRNVFNRYKRLIRRNEKKSLTKKEE